MAFLNTPGGCLVPALVEPREERREEGVEAGVLREHGPVGAGDSALGAPAVEAGGPLGAARVGRVVRERVEDGERRGSLRRRSVVGLEALVRGAPCRAAVAARKWPRASCEGPGHNLTTIT